MTNLERDVVTQDVHILYEINEKSDFFLNALYMMTFEDDDDLGSLAFK